MGITRIVAILIVLALAAPALLVALTAGPYPQAPAPENLIDASDLTPSAVAPRPDRRTVIVLLFDGLAPTLVDAQNTPHLDRMRREGAWTHNMVPPFPTISLISGFTISTGCWPERHGIISNRFLDPERGFYDHSKDQDWILSCEQLHEVAESQGVPTATFDWYGQASTSRGKLARDVEHSPSWESFPDDVGRARQVIERLALPADRRPQLILAYFKGPDGAAHFKGMDADETAAAVSRVDRVVGEIIEAIEMHGLRDRTALIVTTDHGMRPVTHIINLEYILRSLDIDARVVATGTTGFLYFEDPTQVDAAVAKLSTFDSFDLIRPNDPPSWSHLGNGPRVGDLIVSAKPPYAIEDRGQLPWYLRWIAFTGPELVDTSDSLLASHGYPPDTPGVAGLLYAWGDGIRSNRNIERLDAIDIHPTVAHLLDIRPGQPVDGKIARALVLPQG